MGFGWRRTGICRGETLHIITSPKIHFPAPYLLFLCLYLPERRFLSGVHLGSSLPLSLLEDFLIHAELKCALFFLFFAWLRWRPAEAVDGGSAASTMTASERGRDEDGGGWMVMIILAFDFFSMRFFSYLPAFPDFPFEFGPSVALSDFQILGRSVDRSCSYTTAAAAANLHTFSCLGKSRKLSSFAVMEWIFFLMLDEFMILASLAPLCCFLGGGDGLF